MTQPDDGSNAAFRVGFVEGATPDKWARVWRERFTERLELVPLEPRTQEAGLRDGTLAMALLRAPVDRDLLHLIPLYEEDPVVVAGRDHLVAAADEVTLADLADEQLVHPLDPGHGSDWTPSVDQLAWPPMTWAEAIETVAAGTGVAIVPQSVARLHHRRDVVVRPVLDLSPTRIGLAWRIDDDDPRLEDFIGVVRGRTARSSRGR